MEDEFILPTDWALGESAIKVIGVGGGGCNAVTYMYNKQIKGCTFIVCNSDADSLKRSNVPRKIHMGQGLGAGTDPVRGRNLALESAEAIERAVLGEDTKMLFITAGMGGGTGTGAAPVIAKMAHDKGILTVAVVTLPFKSERNGSMAKAIDGIKEIEKNVDSLLIIQNEKLIECYGQELIHNALKRTDDILATAVSGIIEIITSPGYVNVDFQDVTNVISASGMAVMGTGVGEGENRLADAVNGALKSPLLYQQDIRGARNALVNITVSKDESGISFTELDQINQLISDQIGSANKFKQGIVYDENPDFEGKVRVTVIATGFKMDDLEGLLDNEADNTIHIKTDYVYSEEPAGGVVDLPSDGSERKRKIGFNTEGNSPTLSFPEGFIPALRTEDPNVLRLLHATPAIRRTAKKS